jgi:hypothetical protein
MGIIIGRLAGDTETTPGGRAGNRQPATSVMIQSTAVIGGSWMSDEQRERGGMAMGMGSDGTDGLPPARSRVDAGRRTTKGELGPLVARSGQTLAKAQHHQEIVSE